MSSSDRFKSIAEISVVQYGKYKGENKGDVQGGFDRIKLEKHIEEFGHAGLLETLAWMHWQVWESVRELNSKRDNQNVESGL